MAKSGFQPVCVLYQGNKSPFDGSCQLVCRHQIQNEDFKQGDLVKVVNLVKSDPGGSSNGVDSPETRKAIVMGEEMMMTLMGTLFQTKSAGEMSSSKKRKLEDEEQTPKEAASKKQEMVLLQHIFFTVKQLKEEVFKQMQELSHMKQRQIQMMNFLDGAIRTQEEQPPEDLASPTITVKMEPKEDEEDDEEEEEVDVEENSGPVIASVSSACSDSAGVVAEDGSKTIPQDDGSQSVSEPAGQAEELDFVYSAIDIAEGEDEPEEVKTGVLDNRKSYLQEYLLKWSRGGNVEIGNLNMKVLMPQAELEDMLYKTNNPTGYAYRLAGKCFTSREMIEGNTRGGGQRTDGECFKQLNPDVVEMITGEVKKRFPTTASESLLGRSVRNAINERARNERKRLNRMNLPPYTSFGNGNEVS